LVPLAILAVVAAGDVRRERHVPVRFHDRIGRRRGAHGEDPLAAIRDDLDRRIARPVEHLADAHLPRGAHERRRLPSVRAEEEHLHLAARGAARFDPRWQHARVVEDEQIARCKERRQVADGAVLGDVVEQYLESAAVAIARRSVRDQLCGELVVVRSEIVSAGRARGRHRRPSTRRVRSVVPSPSCGAVSSRFDASTVDDLVRRDALEMDVARRVDAQAHPVPLMRLM
jgi:hypothetical protein